VKKLYSAKWSALIILMIIILLLLPAFSGFRSEPAGKAGGSVANKNAEAVLLIYAAAGVREALLDISAAYNLKQPLDRVELRFVFNNSGRLLTQIEFSGEGDLYISSDDLFMEKAHSKGLIREWSRAAKFIPAIIVPRGNPAGIKGLSDLARPGLRVILAEESAAMGRAAERILRENGLFEAVSENVAARVATAPQVVLNIALGQGDAGITGYNSAGEMQEKIEFIPIPPEQNSITYIAVAVLESAVYPLEANDFLQFMISPDGQDIFKANGFGSLDNHN
jgi:molybdate transport system substrate-binding protein